MLKLSSFFTAILCAMTSLAWAGQTIYDCAPGNIEARYGWISERIIVIVDEDNKSASVIDAYINHIHKEPIPVEYSELNNGKIRVKWKVSGIPVRGNANGSATWSATISPKKAEMTVRAIVAGYDNRPRGQGACVVSRQK